MEIITLLKQNVTNKFIEFLLPYPYIDNVNHKKDEADSRSKKHRIILNFR